MSGGEPGRSGEDPEAERPGPDVSLHLLGTEGVLFDTRRQRLYRADTAATFVWCCLEDAMDPAAIAAQLARRAGLGLAIARAHVDAALRQWRTLGLIGEGSPTRPAAASSPPISSVPRQAAAPAAAASYRLLDSRWRLRFATAELFERVHPFLSHLAPEGLAAEAELDLLPEVGGFVLCEAGIAVERCAALDQVMPMVRRGLCSLALRDSGELCAVHAGALRRGGRCLLLPGRAGSGKSTLCAGLIGAGFELFGDDTVVLSRGDLAAQPLPLGICLKPGAWAAVAASYTELRKLPVHRRLDGQRARYLTPGDGAISADVAARAPIAWLVFPTYRPDRAASLVPLDKAAALQSLLAEFYPLPQGLDAGAVAALVRWIDAVDCFALSLPSLTAGVALLDELCR
jgi:hypothetical protein